jgi:Ca2+-binding RTX toxin-like protein
VAPGFFDRPNPPYEFPDFDEYTNFPTTPDGRGAYVNLATGRGDNGRAPAGGGFDEEVDSGFEIVIGTAFPDYLVGTSGNETFYGGGGADVIIGGGGTDVAHGGAEGDSCADVDTADGCEFSDEQVAPRNPNGIAAGLMAPGTGGGPALYLTGSPSRDEVTAAYSTGAVTFTLGPGSVSGFDAAATTAGACSAPVGNQVSCAVSSAPDSIVLAGLGGDDRLSTAGFPDTTSVIALGGAGDDEITGAGTEDALVDGAGDDSVSAGGGDDAVPNNEGDDNLDAGAGDDLFVSDAICNGDSLDGGPGNDNANWAQFGEAVAIDMAAGSAGLIGAGGHPQCPSASLLTSLSGLEDTEGTSFGDIMVGDSGSNQLLGRPGPDQYFAGAGNDSILANSGTPGPDPDPVIDCGEGFDTAQIDFPENGPDAAPTGCEAIHEREPNSFRPPDTPPGPEPLPPPPPPPPPPPVDRKPPQTRIAAHPRKVLKITRGARRVRFRFAADERATFVCRLDRRKPVRCTSPRAYRVGPGAHEFRVAATDAAGNTDPSPAVARFRVRRR